MNRWFFSKCLNIHLVQLLQARVNYAHRDNVAFLLCLASFTVYLAGADVDYTVRTSETKPTK